MDHKIKLWVDQIFWKQFRRLHISCRWILLKSAIPPTHPKWSTYPRSTVPGLPAIHLSLAFVREVGEGEERGGEEGKKTGGGGKCGKVKDVSFSFRAQKKIVRWRRIKSALFTPLPCPDVGREGKYFSCSDNGNTHTWLHNNRSITSLRFRQKKGAQKQLLILPPLANNADPFITFLPRASSSWSGARCSHRCYYSDATDNERCQFTPVHFFRLPLKLKVATIIIFALKIMC